MSNLMVIAAQVHDEALRYVYMLGVAPLLGTIGTVGLVGTFGFGLRRVRFAVGRRPLVRRSGVSACARP